MKAIFTSISLFTVLAGFSQTPGTGIQFEHNTSWQAVLSKAKKENKYIFIDAFTTWCGPCKVMAKNIFPLEEVGKFYNANYINLKVQLDTTKNDNEEVKQWYQDAHDIMINYQVRVFPTYLFIAPDGKLVHRAVGASDASAFIEKGRNGLDPNMQYYTLAEKYKNGERGADFLKRLAKASMEAYDQENMRTYVNAYLGTQTDLLTEENIRFMAGFTTSSQDKGFALMLKNPEAFDAVLGKGMAKGTTRMIIMQEDILPVIWGRNTNWKWEDIEQTVVGKYPSIGKEVVAYSKVFSYQQEGDWDNFAPAVVSYMQLFGNDASPIEMNNFAWAIFENCDDMTCIEKAIDWANRAKAAGDPNFYDTYANLLYKAGKKEEAIKAQQETIALAKSTKNSNLSEFEATLEKMKKGEKTW